MHSMGVSGPRTRRVHSVPVMVRHGSAAVGAKDGDGPGALRRAAMLLVPSPAAATAWAAAASVRVPTTIVRALVLALSVSAIATAAAFKRPAGGATAPVAAATSSATATTPAAVALTRLEGRDRGRPAGLRGRGLVRTSDVAQGRALACGIAQPGATRMLPIALVAVFIVRVLLRLLPPPPPHTPRQRG